MSLSNETYGSIGNKSSKLFAEATCVRSSSSNRNHGPSETMDNDPTTKGSNKNNSYTMIMIGVSVVAVMVLCFVVLCVYYTKHRKDGIDRYWIKSANIGDISNDDDIHIGDPTDGNVSRKRTRKNKKYSQLQDSLTTAHYQLYSCIYLLFALIFWNYLTEILTEFQL